GGHGHRTRSGTTDGAAGGLQTRRAGPGSHAVLCDGKTLCYRCRVCHLQRSPADSWRLWLYSRIPAGTLSAGQSGAPDSGRHQRDHASYHRAPPVAGRCHGVTAMTDVVLFETLAASQGKKIAVATL